MGDTLRGLRSWFATRLRGRRLLVLLAWAAALAASVATIPGLDASGAYKDRVVMPLGTDEAVRGASTAGGVDVNVDGFFVRAGASGSVTVPMRIPAGEGLPVVRMWAGSPVLGSAEASVSGPGGVMQLGETEGWVGQAFAIDAVAGPGDLVRVRVEANNTSGLDALVLDQLAGGLLAAGARQSTPAWLFGLWVGLIALAGVAALGRAARHWLAVPLLGAGAALLWQGVRDAALLPLNRGSIRLWEAAGDADLLSLDSGLLSGSFGALSHLAVQLYAVIAPLAGNGDAAARTAAAIVGVAALVILYIGGNRVAGRAGAVTAPLVALAADPFRAGVESASAVPCLVFAAALFVLAVHPCLAETSRYAAGLLGAAAAVAVLAEPLWLPGAIIAMIVLVRLYGTEGNRWRVLGTGLLVLTLLLLPNRISTADQNRGDMFADITLRSTYARNVEYAGRGYGAVLPDRLPVAPFGGRPVDLGEYLFGQHSLSVVIGGTLSGANDALGAFGDRGESKLFGLLAFILALVGSVYLLLLPRLRVLLLLPMLVAAPTLFFASRGAYHPFAAGAPVWPAFLLSVGVLVFALNTLTAGRFGRTRRSSLPRRHPRENPVASSDLSESLEDWSPTEDAPANLGAGFGR